MTLVKYIRDSAMTFGTQIAGVALSVAAAIVIARVLGPSAKGIIAIVTLVPAMFALFGNMGIGIANVYFAGKKKYPVDDLISNSISMSVLLGFSLFLALFLFRNWLAERVLKSISPLFLILSLGCIPFSLLTQYSVNILQGVARFKRFNLVHLTLFGSKFLLVLLLVLVMKKSVSGGVWAVVGSILLASGVSLLLLRDLGRVRFGLNTRLVRDSFLYGIKGHVGNVLQFFNYRLDVFVVNYFLGPKQVGFYTAGVALAELLWHIPQAFATTLFPKTASSSREEVSDFTSKVCRNVLFLTVVGALLLALLAKPLIFLTFGPVFYPSLIPLWILLIGVVALSLSKLLTSDLAGRGMPQYGTYLTTISLFFTIVLDFTLIPRWGIAGAAVATTVAYGASGALALYWFCSVSKKGLRECLVINKCDIMQFRRFILRGVSGGG